MELLVSLVFFSVIVMGMSAFDIFGHFHSITSDRRALLQNELSLVVEHITKNVTGGSHCASMPCTPVFGGAIGDINHPAFIPDNDQQGFSIRWDNGYGTNYTLDGWVGYHQGITGSPNTANAMYFYENDSPPNANPRDIVANPHSGTGEVIATHLLPTAGIASGKSGFELNPPSSVYYTNGCTIVLRARWDPNAAITLENPEAEIQTTIIAPAVSAN